jgi:hypothetical protein
MSTDKATPRPWATGGGITGQIWSEINGFTVAFTVKAENEEVYFSPEEIRANAALIVKAVNLIDELVWCLDRFVAYGDVFAYRAGELNPYKKAKELLAKAKETP